MDECDAEVLGTRYAHTPSRITIPYVTMRVCVRVCVCECVCARLWARDLNVDVWVRCSSMGAWARVCVVVCARACARGINMR